MYSKQQASQIRQNFWTSFGQYMRPVIGAGGEPVTWLNYKTGIRHLYFRMDADKNGAHVAIEFHQPDTSLQQHYFDQFRALKKMLEQELGESWTWEMHTVDEHGKTYSRIYAELKDVNIFNSADWPAIISFFKPRIIALDRFWDLVKDGFE